MENGLQVASQIPWFTIVRIIGKSKSNEEILWYINQTHKFGWSKSQVLKQFENKAYERNLIEPYVVIEVKNRKFMPLDLGQLIFYVSAIDNLKRKALDNESVGLVLCKDSNSFVAKNTLSRINAKVGISKYKIFEELPEYLEKRLNEK